MRLQLAAVTRMTCSFWIASRRSPDDLRELRLARTTPRVRHGTTVNNEPGTPPGVPLRCPCHSDARSPPVARNTLPALNACDVVCSFYPGVGGRRLLFKGISRCRAVPRG